MKRGFTLDIDAVTDMSITFEAGQLTKFTLPFNFGGGGTIVSVSAQLINLSGYRYQRYHGEIEEAVGGPARISITIACNSATVGFYPDGLPSAIVTSGNRQSFSW